MPTKFKAIVPKKANFDIKPMVKAVKKTVDEADKLFAKTYKTWRNKPEYDKDLNVKSDKIEGSTTTSGDGSKDHPLPFVERGTKVRYATMTPDFSPKTEPRLIDSRPGSGGVAYVDTRRPRPGIEAREFEPEVADIMEPKFEGYGQDAMAEVAKKSGHQL